MNAEEIMNSLRAMVSADLWCKDWGEKIATDQMFINALRKAGRGMPQIVKRMCLELGYLRKEGERLTTTYFLTPKGELFADEEESNLNSLIKHFAEFRDI